MSLVIGKGITLKRGTDPAVNGFSSFTYSGPFLRPSGGWSIGTPGGTPYGVGIKPAGFDEAIHDASGSVM